MLSKDVIEPVQNKWAFSVVLATNNDGSLRFCIDYCRLNDMTIRDTYPISWIDECIDKSLGGAKIFSILHANSGYWPVELFDGYGDKTTFTTHRGTHLF